MICTKTVCHGPNLAQFKLSWATDMDAAGPPPPSHAASRFDRLYQLGKTQMLVRLLPSVDANGSPAPRAGRQPCRQIQSALSAQSCLHAATSQVHQVLLHDLRHCTSKLVSATRSASSWSSRQTHSTRFRHRSTASEGHNGLAMCSAICMSA